MTVVVSVRFSDSGRIYYFDPGHLGLSQGELVVVETVHGLELGKVIYGEFEVSEEEVVGDLKPVIRRAEDADFQRSRSLQERHPRVMNICNTKIREHGLSMRLIKAEYNFDGSRLTFYFTSEHRVDFRMLVRDLAYTFKTRIELRQIGPRDKARLLGGIGMCGREFCCKAFLPNYARVSVKMAKEQDLPLNPSKISGACGRLLCCLSYEHGQYQELKQGLPRRGARVKTPDGAGEVVEVNVLRQTVTVQLATSGMQENYPVANIREMTEDEQIREQVKGTRLHSTTDDAAGQQCAHPSYPDLLDLLDQELLDLEDLPPEIQKKARSRFASAGPAQKPDHNVREAGTSRRPRSRARRPTSETTNSVNQPESTRASDSTSRHRKRKPAKDTSRQASGRAASSSESSSPPASEKDTARRDSTTEAASQSTAARPRPRRKKGRKS